MPKASVSSPVSNFASNDVSLKELETLNLMEGHFTPEDASSVIMSVLSDKIRYHEMKNFSSMERLGMKDSNSVSRLADLKMQISKLKEIIAFAEREQLDLFVHSDIHISFAPPKQDNK